MERRTILDRSDGIRIALMLASLGLFCLTAYTELLSRTYWHRVAIAAACMSAVGILGGFRPQSEDRATRRWMMQLAAIWPLAIVIRATASLAGIDHAHSDERQAIIQSPHFLVPAILFVSASFFCTIASSALFRRLHPDQAFVPAPEEDKLTPEEEAAARRAFLRWAVPIVIFFLLAIFLGPLFPHQHLHIMIVAVLMSFGVLSLVAGVKWPQMGQRRWLFIMLAAIGPVAGFVGFYGAAKMHDSVHLVRALQFSAWIAAACIIPFLMYRAVTKLRNG